MSAPLIRITGAHKRYRGGERPALAGVDLDLTPGAVTALLGPSGSGKSTLLRAIAGLEELDAGEIRAGEEIWSGPGRHRPPEDRRIGMVFQDYALFPHLTALDNVGFGLRGADRRARAMAALEAAELGAKARAYPHELSGGEQQRVALARALAPRPDLVLLDEPFSGLDRRLRGELRERTLAALKSAGAASLIVTHDAEEAMACADRLALMREGRLIQTGVPAEVYLGPESEAAARLLGEVNIWSGAAEGGRLTTPVGDLATDAPDGSRLTALIRPEGLTLQAEADGPLTVLAARSLGADILVRFTAPDGSEWTARLRPPAGFAPGDGVTAILDPVFARLIAEES